MSLDGGSVLALVHRLAVVDARARSRIARLLVIGQIEAGVVLALADGRRLTLAGLQAELDLSPGGARALAAQLEREALVVRERDPESPRGICLRLSAGAELELAAALHRLIARLDAIADRLAGAEADVVAVCLDQLADALGPAEDSM